MKTIKKLTEGALLYLDIILLVSSAFLFLLIAFNIAKEIDPITIAQIALLALILTLSTRIEGKIKMKGKRVLITPVDG